MRNRASLRVGLSVYPIVYPSVYPSRTRVKLFIVSLRTDVIIELKTQSAEVAAVATVRNPVQVYEVVYISRRRRVPILDSEKNRKVVWRNNYGRGGRTRNTAVVIVTNRSKVRESLPVLLLVPWKNWVCSIFSNEEVLRILKYSLCKTWFYFDTNPVTVIITQLIPIQKRNTTWRRIVNSDILGKYQWFCVNIRNT